MTPRTTHISYSKSDYDLHSELMRHSALKHIPASLQARLWMRAGMKLEQKQKAQLI